MNLSRISNSAIGKRFIEWYGKTRAQAAKAGAQVGGYAKKGAAKAYYRRANLGEITKGGARMVPSAGAGYFAPRSAKVAAGAAHVGRHPFAYGSGAAAVGGGGVVYGGMRLRRKRDR